MANLKGGVSRRQMLAAVSDSHVGILRLSGRVIFNLIIEILHGTCARFSMPAFQAWGPLVFRRRGD